MELYKPFDFLSINECQEVIQYSKTRTLYNSGVSNDRTVNYNPNADIKNNVDVWVNDKRSVKKYKEPSHVDNEYRKSKACRLLDKKYNKKILDLFKTFDKNLVVDEPPEIIFYEPGDFFNWHTDHLTWKRRHWFRLRDFERVLSVTVELQPESNAGLYFDYRRHPHIPRTHDYKPVPLKQGQAIVFTCTDMHKVANDGKQTRISLVASGSSLVK
tara:strand:- start:45 stop:686 length:642 start_codon:yes stop_codon:yes gene_type:complete